MQSLIRLLRNLDQGVNHLIANHGGGISFVGARQRTLFITMSDGRHECASSQVTLRHGFEVMLEKVAL